MPPMIGHPVDDRPPTAIDPAIASAIRRARFAVNEPWVNRRWNPAVMP